MADEEKKPEGPNAEAPKPEAPKPAAPAGEPKAAAPKPPPPPPGAKPAPPPKPKGPQQEPWSSPLVDALKEKFGGEFIKSYSFLTQNQIEVKKDRIAEIMMFLRDNTISPFDYLVDETAVHWPKTEEFEIVYILYSFAKNRSEEHTSELQSRAHLLCRLLREKKKLCRSNFGNTHRRRGACCDRPPGRYSNRWSRWP